MKTAICRLSLGRPYEDFHADPRILRAIGANIQWMIRPTLSQTVDTSQKFFQLLPAEVVDVVYSLRTVQQIQDALFCSREKSPEAFLDQYNIYDHYWHSLDKHEEWTAPEGASIQECYLQWEKTGFVRPCHLVGCCRYDDLEESLIFFLGADTSTPPWRPDRDAQFFYALAKSTAVAYNTLVTRLFNKGYLYYPAFLEQPDIRIIELPFPRKTFSVCL